MEPKRTMEELTRRSVAIIAEMELAAAQVRTRGDRIAERLAAWVGSWTFLITQSIILLAWMALSITAYFRHWDPYPFVLLNLALAFRRRRWFAWSLFWVLLRFHRNGSWCVNVNLRMADEIAAYSTLSAFFLRGNLGSLFARFREPDGYRLLFAFCLCRFAAFLRTFLGLVHGRFDLFFCRRAVCRHGNPSSQNVVVTCRWA
jgi:hypothetical protein